MRLVFGVAFAVLFSTIAVSVFVINKLNQNGRWVAHTHEVIAKVNEVEVHYGNARVSTKNYLLTRQPRHLAPRIVSVKFVIDGLSKIQQLTSDNMAQQRQVEAARNAVNQYFSFTGKILAAADQGEDLQSRLGKWTDETNHESESVALWMQRMRDEEERLLSVRQDEAVSFVSQAYSTLPVMLLVQVVMTAYIYYRVINECTSFSKNSSSPRTD